MRLLPSIYRDAIDANLRYLHRLEPDRLLHNFRASAGLPPKGEPYGAWEGDTIAGHTLGHYPTALSLMHAQTGDAECRRRVDYIVGELALCPAAHGDFYVAGFTRRRQDGAIEDGKALFPELIRGEIRSQGFDLDGCWVPFYNWHKTFAGLFDAEIYCGSRQARAVALGLASYIDRVFGALSDAQVQQAPHARAACLMPRSGQPPFHQPAGQTIASTATKEHPRASTSVGNGAYLCIPRGPGSERPRS